MTVYQLQRTITQLWKDEDEFARNATFPLIPVTPELIQMEDDWIIQPDSILTKLKTGAVLQVEKGVDNRSVYGVPSLFDLLPSSLRVAIAKDPFYGLEQLSERKSCLYSSVLSLQK
jgi:hypothetical protein